MIFFYILMLVFSIDAFADCRAQDINLLNFTPSVINFNTNTQTTVTYSISHAPFYEGVRRCFFFGTADYGTANTWTARSLKRIGGGATIPYNVYSNSNYANNRILRVPSDASSQQHVVYYRPFFRRANTTVTLTKEFFAQLGTVPVGIAPGTYTDSLVFSIYADTFRLDPADFIYWPLVAVRAIQFIYTVPKELDLAIVSSGQTFDLSATAMMMSFGELESGEARVASVLVKTNVGYRLFASSSNQGNLRHISSAAQVPYTLLVSGAPVSLVGSNNSPVELSSSATSSSTAGFEIPIEVQIGTLTGSEEGGDYSDLLYLSIEAF